MECKELQNKLPNALSESDLLALLDDKTVIEKHVNDDPALPSPIKFTTVFNISPGNHRIKTSVLYKFYRKYAQSSAVSQKEFSRQLMDFLNYSKSKATFGINERVIKLSQRMAVALLKKPKKYTNKLLKQHIDKFIAAFKLERGNNFVDIDEVYEKYWIWAAKTRKQKRLPVVRFINVLQLYFTIQKNQHGITMIGFEKYDGKEEKTEN